MEAIHCENRQWCRTTTCVYETTRSMASMHGRLIMPCIIMGCVVMLLHNRTLSVTNFGDQFWTGNVLLDDLAEYFMVCDQC